MFFYDRRPWIDDLTSYSLRSQQYDTKESFTRYTLHLSSYRSCKNCFTSWLSISAVSIVIFISIDLHIKKTNKHKVHLNCLAVNNTQIHNYITFLVTLIKSGTLPILKGFEEWMMKVGRLKKRDRHL